MTTLLPANVLHALSAANRAHLLSLSFFPNLISAPFLLGFHAAFYLSAAICVIAALASLLRGERYVYGQTKASDEVATGQDMILSQEEASSTR